MISLQIILHKFVALSVVRSDLGTVLAPIAARQLALARRYELLYLVGENRHVGDDEPFLVLRGTHVVNRAADVLLVGLRQLLHGSNHLVVVDNRLAVEGLRRLQQFLVGTEDGIELLRVEPERAVAVYRLARIQKHACAGNRITLVCPHSRCVDFLSHILSSVGIIAQCRNGRKGHYSSTFLPQASFASTSAFGEIHTSPSSSSLTSPLFLTSFTVNIPAPSAFPSEYSYAGSFARTRCPT